MLSSDSKIKSKRDGKLASKTAAIADDEPKDSHQDGEESKAMLSKQPAALCSNCQTTKPKGVKGPYMFFYAATFPKLQTEETKTSMTDCAKLIGTMWAELEDKSKYNKMHEEDQERFKKQKEEIAQNGFFVMEDGKRSCDVVAKKPVTRGEVTPAVKVAKAVKTRDRGTQTAAPKTGSKKRPVSADGSFEESKTSKAKKGTIPTPPASKKRKAADAGVGTETPSKSPQKRAKVVAVAVASKDKSEVAGKKTPVKRTPAPSANQSAAMGSAKKAKAVTFAKH